MVGLKCWGHVASLCPLARTTKVCSNLCVCLRCPPPSFVHPHVCVGVGGGTQVFVWVRNGGKPSAHLMSAGSFRENKRKKKNVRARCCQSLTDISCYKEDTLLIVLNLCITNRQQKYLIAWQTREQKNSLSTQHLNCCFQNLLWLVENEFNIFF